MNKLFLFLLFIIFTNLSHAQELNATVQVDYSQIQTSSTLVFETLQRSLQNFINTTKWTNKRYKNYEKIDCSFVIIVSEKPKTNSFKATLQVFSSRPVYNSTYTTPVVNWQDKDFSFDYTMNEQLIFNERRFSDKNLTDVIAFYVYLILGYDGDTFSNKGGTEYYDKAQQISINAESQNKFSGWGRADGLRARSSIIKNILQKDLEALRTTWYQYHLNGLDLMYNQERQAKRNIYNSINVLNQYKQQIGQSYALEFFFGAKKEEIYKIYTGGEDCGLPITKLQEVLVNLSPSFIQKWEKLKG